MSNSCVFCPKAKNRKTGEEVPSKLFMGLLDYSSNDRQFAKENYVLGTSKEFKEQFGDQVEYNDLDEPTVDSFLKLVDKEYSKEKRIKSLNRQLGSGTFSYTEADSRRQFFEQQADRDVNANYTTVMTPGENHQCKVEVGENNQANRQTTRDTLANKNLFDRIKAAVQALGGDITFIDERFSRYTTENAQKLANGLHAVIQLAKGGNLTADLAHEAGHFAVGALGKDNKLVKRLENSLSEEVMEQLLGDDFDTIRFSENPKREAMGALVGRYIANEVDKKSMPAKLLGRIVSSVKKMFYKLSGDTVSRMRLDAREAAEQIASNFLSQKNAGNIENALDTKETLFNVVDDGATKIFKNILKDMSLMAKEVGAFDKSMEKEINSLIAEIADGRIISNGSALQAAMSASGILDALDYLTDMVPTIQGLLTNVTYDMMHLTQSATNLREVSTFVKQLDSILTLTEDLLGNSNVSGIDQYEIPIRNIRNSLKTTKENLMGNLQVKEKRLFLAFLREAYGKDYIERAGRMVFKNGKVTYQEGTKVMLDESFLESAEYGSDWIEWITSMSNSSDLVNQIVYKATQAYTTQANMNTMRALEDLRELRAFCERNNVDTEHLFERYTHDVFAEDENGHSHLIHEKGEITGNYITELDWGSWEEEYRAFRQSLRRDFEAQNPSHETMLKQVYDIKLAEYSKKRINEWHIQHSYYNTKLGQYEPLGFQDPGHPNAGAYYNNDYDTSLSDAEKQAAQKFLDIKQEHDNFLTQRTRRQGEAFAVFVSPVRMPQFRGRINDETATIARESHKFPPKAYASVLKKRLIGAFTHQANDQDYGNENTNQTINDDVFSKEYRDDLGDIRRVATYGINKFRDMNELTHDLFAGMLQYSAMANTYNVQYQLSNILEVGSDVLSERRVNSTKRDKDRDKPSAIFQRYKDFLNSQVYNLYYNNKHDERVGGLFAVDKAVGTLNSVMSKIYLSGNVGGALVNTGTGMVEMFKEAVAGSLYSIKDLGWANKQFERYLPSFWIRQAGKEDKTDKMSLFLQMFDAGNRFEEKVRNYSTKATRAWNLNPFGHNVMVLYSSGDYYMQALSYLAVSRHVKIKLKDGTTCSLWDALEPGVKDPNNPDSPIVLKYKDNVETREVNGQTMHVYVDKDGQERVWEIDGQSEYQDACRETNNRMHGVYNRLDKSMVHSTLIGKALSTMKGYVYGYLARKLTPERYSVALGRESEGEWDTFLKTFVGMFKGDYGFGTGLKVFAASLLFPLGKRQERFIRKCGYSVEQYRNMRRTWFTNAFIAATSLIVWATAHAVGLGGDDDDDDDKYTAEEKKILRKQYKELGYDTKMIAYLLGEEKAYERAQVKRQYQDLGYSDEVVEVLMDSYDESNTSRAKDHPLLGITCYYLMGRLSAEQAAYTTLLGMDLERQSTLNFTPLFWNAISESAQLCADLLSQDEVDRGSYKGMKKWQKDIISKTPYIRSWPLFDNPYESYDNWEFGRRMGR